MTEQPYLPFQQHSDTSRAAAEAFQPRAETELWRVWSLFKTRHEAGQGGLTDEEVQAHLEMGSSTERPRRIDLVRRGILRDSTARRPTSSGRAAVVWEWVPESER